MSDRYSRQAGGNGSYRANQAGGQARRERYGNAPETGYGRQQSSPYGQREGNRRTSSTGSRPQNTPNTSNASNALPLGRIIPVVILCAMVIVGGLFFSSGSRLEIGNAVVSKDFIAELDYLADSVRAEALSDSDVYKLERTRILPWNELPCPEPDRSAFNVTYGESDGRAETWSYSDPTITVKGWTEYHANTKFYFSEVKIAHASQLRTALAGGSFGKEDYPSNMAKTVNSVIATNGDYSGYRESGMIIRQNVSYRAKQYERLTWDVLMIDEFGDFYISDDRHLDLELLKSERRYVDSNGISHNIVNTMHFGPSLVVDGKRNILHMQSGCGNQVNEEYKRSHTAIGQLGELHYLMCCAEETDAGMRPASTGVNIPTMADIMAEKNCIQAYNLDGGQSTTMVFGNDTLNFVNRGGERQLSEIIYFASAQGA